MVNDLAAGTQASIALMNEEGLEDAIIPLTGDFRDKRDVLSFNDGQFQVLMDSDRCNSALKDGLEDNDEATEVEDGADEEGNTDLFKRNLRNPVSSTSTKSTSNSRVLARHRDEYTEARLAIQEGRHLSEMSFVEIEMEEEEVSRDGTKALLHSTRLFVPAIRILYLKILCLHSQVKMNRLITLSRIWDVHLRLSMSSILLKLDLKP